MTPFNYQSIVPARIELPHVSFQQDQPSKTVIYNSVDLLIPCFRVVAWYCRCLAITLINPRPSHSSCPSRGPHIGCTCIAFHKTMITCMSHVSLIASPRPMHVTCRFLHSIFGFILQSCLCDGLKPDTRSCRRDKTPISQNYNSMDQIISVSGSADQRSAQATGVLCRNTAVALDNHSCIAPWPAWRGPGDPVAGSSSRDLIPAELDRQ